MNQDVNATTMRSCQIKMLTCNCDQICNNWNWGSGSF